jgi:hypothetical protein
MKVRSISLSEQDVEELEAIGRKVLVPLGIKATVPATIRYLKAMYGKFNEEQQRKYSEAIDNTMEEES